MGLGDAGDLGWGDAVFGGERAAVGSDAGGESREQIADAFVGFGHVRLIGHDPLIDKKASPGKSKTLRPTGKGALRRPGGGLRRGGGALRDDSGGRRFGSGVMRRAAGILRSDGGALRDARGVRRNERGDLRRDSGGGQLVIRLVLLVPKLPFGNALVCGTLFPFRLAKGNRVPQRTDVPKLEFGNEGKRQTAPPESRLAPPEGQAAPRPSAKRPDQTTDGPAATPPGPAAAPPRPAADAHSSEQTIRNGVVVSKTVSECTIFEEQKGAPDDTSADLKTDDSEKKPRPVPRKCIAVGKTHERLDIHDEDAASPRRGYQNRRG